MKNQNIIVACLITTIIAGSIGYTVGSRSQAFNRSSQFGNRTNGRQFPIASGGGMMSRGGPLNGEVTAKDNKTLTIRLMDGSSKIIILSDNTTYRTATDTSQDKVEIGSKIAAFGTTSTDGTTLATSIEVNPILPRK